MVGHKHVPHENNAGMANQSIEITALNFLGQSQVLFDHFKEHLDIPTFSVDANNVFSGQVDIRGQNRQPGAAMPVANEHQFCTQARWKA